MSGTVLDNLKETIESLQDEIKSKDKLLVAYQKQFDRDIATFLAYRGDTSVLQEMLAAGIRNTAEPVPDDVGIATGADEQ